MSTAGQKWLLGCAIGCGVLLVVAVAILAGGAYLIQGTMEDFEAAGKVSDELEQRFGEVRDYCPPADAVLHADRVEAFLAVRETLRTSRGEMAATLERLAQMEADGPGSVGEVVGAVRAGFALLPRLARYATARNEALLEQRMGEGEYAYLYNVIYYGWLGKSPEDGPSIVIVSEDGDQRHMDERDVREMRSERLRRRGNADLLPMLRCQMKALDETSVDDAGWRPLLAAEIRAAEQGRLRIPWSHGVPDAAARTLEPYRKRLENSYSPVCNALELGLGGS